MVEVFSPLLVIMASTVNTIVSVTGALNFMPCSASIFEITLRRVPLVFHVLLDRLWLAVLVRIAASSPFTLPNLVLKGEQTKNLPKLSA